MDSIFDEDVDEVGGEIEAYCPSPRCKADTTHTIISMYEDEVRRVQCVVCGDVHAYRKPRGDAPEESVAEQPRKRLPSKPSWEDALSRASDADFGNCRPYSIRDTYEEGDILSHPVFDIGIVTELLPDNKVEVLFKEPPPRILVHNRGDLAQRMPGISETPPPREAKKKKRAKKKDEPAVVAPRRGGKELADAIELARHAAASKVDGAGKPTPKGGKPVKPAPAPAAKEAPKGKPAVAAAKGAAKSAAPAAHAAPAPHAAHAAKKAAKPVPAKAAPAAKKPAAPAKKPAAPAKKPAPAKKAAAPAKKKPAPAKKKPAPAKGKAKPKKK